MKRHLKNKEIRELIETIESKFGKVNLISKKDRVEIIDDKMILVNEKPLFFYHENELVPTLKSIIENNFLHKITVDMGAVKFVVNGADIMRPGITDIEEGIKKNQIISVVDVNNKRPLCIGKALFNSEEMQKKEKGTVIKNLHHVGDEIWDR